MSCYKNIFVLFCQIHPLINFRKLINLFSHVFNFNLKDIFIILIIMSLLIVFLIFLLVILLVILLITLSLIYLSLVSLFNS